jgi:signal peptidase I
MFARRLGEFFLDILEVIVFAIAIFLFIYLLVMQPHKIKGDSMQPNFPNGEYLLTDKVSYRFNQPSRGDVIVFEAPGENGDEFIKRVIGLPGETVSIHNNHVYINNQLLTEDYIADALTTQGGPFLADNQEITVPSDNVFVLGDNRPASSDSRRWGYVPFKSITGRAWIIYWPPSSMGFVQNVVYGSGN